MGRKLHTTRSWEFLGLEDNGVIHSSSIWKKARFGEDTIIANLDTGVWPESKSFSDEKMGPIPSKWKGICQNDADPGFHCNRKLIGARYFNKGYAAAAGPLSPSLNSPRDKEGHGSHTLSTAGGNFVAGANVFGYGKGTAKGGSPKACVAAYKVCWPPVAKNACFDADILAAFDFVIHDGVDVLSVSLGGDHVPFFNDSLAIGSFHAVKHGIVVVYSAGNSGPNDGTVLNLAPWQITVGASTMDRQFPSYVVLGNKMRFKGESISSKALLKNKFFPIISAADAKTSNSSAGDGLLCKAGTLDPKKVDNAISPMVLLSSLTSILQAPFMAAFSSKGPNTITPEILKPDITAPGLSVIAAYTEAQGPTNEDFDERRVLFNLVSGTSMSCPHVSGIVGLLKTLYPKWSPAAIKSAIMTTATTQDNINEPITNTSYKKATPFDYGAGHVQPNRAIDPGLVYDITVNDYLNFLCALGYNETQITLFSEHNHTCPKPIFSLVNFNYPSITVPKLNNSIAVTRTVKNVGSPGTYSARVQNPTGVAITVKPERLKFEKVGEEKTFKVTMKVEEEEAKKVRDYYVFGQLTWSDGKHNVRSPIVVKTI
ncbi:Subtilisin-like protease SBT5.4 [Camellia lanceoleosa]|uniref:Subtilisin-like protease SBT5.4 n=1 Tax=Camellia lanceoleosa TaxID=1840588 RepID=A0ACC0HAR8_9ERIC|nr:Subtilisin-like protease SBT5.4 [Camellia lanceoleosa]